MEDYKPSSIKVVAILVMITSVVLTLLNGIPLFFYMVIGLDKGRLNLEPGDTGHFFTDHFFQFATLTFGMGILTFVACLGLMNYRMWGNVLLSLNSLGLLVLLWWWTSQVAFGWLGRNDSVESFGMLIIALVSVSSLMLLGLLIFLNSPGVRRHCD